MKACKSVLVCFKTFLSLVKKINCYEQHLTFWHSFENKHDIIIKSVVQARVQVENELGPLIPPCPRSVLSIFS